jgi:hypothetical protein
MVTRAAAGDHACGPGRSQLAVALCLLREAAEAVAAVWCGSPYPQRRTRAQRQLCRTLDDLRAVSAQLAAEATRFAQPGPVARRGEPFGFAGDHGDVLCAAAGLVVSVQDQQAPGQPASGDDLAELLGVVQALAQGACELAGGAGEPGGHQMDRVCDRLTAAAGHLQALPPPGPVPGTGSGRRLAVSRACHAVKEEPA